MGYIKIYSYNSILTFYFLVRCGLVDEGEQIDIYARIFRPSSYILEVIPEPTPTHHPLPTHMNLTLK